MRNANNCALTAQHPPYLRTPQPANTRVISTVATDGLTVRREVERPPHLHLSLHLSLPLPLPLPFLVVIPKGSALVFCRHPFPRGKYAFAFAFVFVSRLALSHVLSLTVVHTASHSSKSKPLF
jgi:hypothetical protein